MGSVKWSGPSRTSHTPACRGPCRKKTKRARSGRAISAGKLLEVFARERFGEKLMRERRLAEEARRLLPLALARDVGVVAAPVGEDREQVRLVLVVVAQPAPRLIVGARKLGERRGPELGVAREEGHDLHRVHVADRAEAAAPRVAVAVGLHQVPPQTHLLFQGRAQRVEDVPALGGFRRVPDEARVLVRVAVEAARRRRVVGVERAAAVRERVRRARDDAVQERAVFQQVRVGS